MLALEWDDFLPGDASVAPKSLETMPLLQPSLNL